MALKKCDECGEEVSTKAEKCPNCGAPVGATANEKRLGCLVIIFIIILISIIVSFCGGKKPSNRTDTNTTSSKEYSGAWKEEASISISRVMVKKNIKGCGWYQYRESSKIPNKYQVRCTPDGVNWTYYIVYTITSEEIIGPLDADYFNE